MKTVLTIAGSDASGGAGIQADIKTLTVHKVYATSCITALTAQNTKGITGIMPVPPDFFEKQMDSVFSDIKPDAVKIGMIASKEQVEIIAKYLQKTFTGRKNVRLDEIWRKLDEHPIFPSIYRNEIKTELVDMYGAQKRRYNPETGKNEETISFR